HGNQFSMNAVPLGHVIGPDSPKHLADIGFDLIKATTAPKNLIQVLDYGGFNLLRPEPLDSALNDFSDDFLMPVVAVDIAPTVSRLANQRHAALPATENPRQEKHPAVGLLEPGAFPLPILSDQPLNLV